RELQPAAPLGPYRAGTAPRQFLLHEVGWIARARDLGGPPVAVLAACLARVVPAPDGRGQQAGQPRVRTRDVPPLGNLGVLTVEQTGASRAVPPLRLLDHEPGLGQHRQVLAYGVVVELN